MTEDREICFLRIDRLRILFGVQEAEGEAKPTNVLEIDGLIKGKKMPGVFRLEFPSKDTKKIMKQIQMMLEVDKPSREATE